MTQPEFVIQIERLKDSFGNKAYPDERVKLIWREVSELSIHWFTRQVDSWIGSLKDAPLLPKIGEAISNERERLWNIAKQNSANDAKDFWGGSTLQPKEAAFNFQIMKDRMKKKIPDDEWAEFLLALEKRGSSIRA